MGRSEHRNAAVGLAVDGLQTLANLKTVSPAHAWLLNGRAAICMRRIQLAQDSDGPTSVLVLVVLR
jgi:hypothetical protein